MKKFIFVLLVLFSCGTFAQPVKQPDTISSTGTVSGPKVDKIISTGTVSNAQLDKINSIGTVSGINDFDLQIYPAGTVLKAKD